MKPSVAFVMVFSLWASLASAAPITLFVHADAGRFDVRTVEADAGALAGARLGLDVDGQTLWAGSARKVVYSGENSGKVAPGQSVTACYEFETPRIDWSVEFELSGDGAIATVASEVRNRGTRPVKLGKCRLVDVAADPSAISLGDQPEETVMLVTSGWGLRNPVCKISGAKGVLTSKTIAPLYNAKAQSSLFLGFLTFDRVNTEIQAAWLQAGTGIELCAYCDFEGHSLAENKSVRSEKLMVLFSRDPQQTLTTWADAVAATYQPRIWPKIPVGWLGWSWVDGFAMERCEDVVRRNASAIRRRLTGFDVEYIWVSLSNLKDVLPGNWLQWNTANYPTPPDRLVEDLRQQGFKLGLWMGAFWMCTLADPQQLEEMKDALLLKDGKPMMAGQRWDYGVGATLPPEQQPDMYILDPTHPKTRAFLRKVLETYYRWGVRYYMIDFLYAISGSTPGAFLYDNCHQQDLITGPEVYRAGLKLIREAAGTDTYLLTSTGPTMQNIGLVDACRTGSDYGEGRPLQPGSEFYPGTFIINQASHWTSHRVATDTLATTGFMHRKLFLADTGNVMTVDKPCPLGDAQITATIFGINGGPMMLGDDIDRMTDERLRLVKQCLPRMPEAAYALDLFECIEPDHPKLFHLPIRCSWENWDLVALFNYSDVPREAVVDLKRLGLDPAADYVAWDFWNERFDGVCKATLRMTAAPQSVKLVRLSRQRPHPWLMATDMHVRQGQAEIEDCQWDASTMTLKVRARRPAGERGNVFLLVPPGMRVVDPHGLWLAKDARNQSLVVRCDFAFADAAVEKTVSFTPVKK
jgi:hypothetical protein